jgi:AraC-like DNA-binding protein
MSTPDLAAEAYRDPTGARDTSSALPGDLVRALDWLRCHLSEPFQLDRLAQISGVRPRTLEAHFQMFLGATPLGWVRRTRLARARRELLNSGPTDTVTDIALSSGFAQLGRFSAHYRKAFGELPSTTMQRTKSLSANRADQNFDEAMRLTLRAMPFAFAAASKQRRAALEELGRPQKLARGSNATGSARRSSDA